MPGIQVYSIVHKVTIKVWMDAILNFGFNPKFKMASTYILIFTMDFKDIFRVMKVIEVILCKMGVNMRSEEHDFWILQSNITKSLYLSHNWVVIWNIQEFVVKRMVSKMSATDCKLL